MKSFNWSIIGHEKNVKYLQSSIKNSKISHGYFFYGSEHLGKKTVAKLFVKSVFCSDFHDAKTVPCQECKHCRSFNDNVHPDLLIVKIETDKKTGKLKKNISIDQIRRVKEVVGLGSFLNSYKIVIIEQADKMSLSASNALLKVLEEPPAKTIFLLISSSKNVPQTILSRCQLINFLPVSHTQIYNYLIKERQASRTLALNISNLALGRPGLINHYLEEDVLKKYYTEIEENINLISAPEYVRILHVEKILPKSLDNEGQKKVSMAWLKTWETIVRDGLLVKVNNNSVNIRYLNNVYIDKIAKSFEKNSVPDIVDFLELIKKSKLYLSSNVSPKLVLENFIIKFNI